MTEERKKELAETFWNDWLPARKPTAIEGLEFLIGTVAAEAREEGIEAAYELLGEGLSLSTAYVKQLHILMERLKEQGK